MLHRAYSGAVADRPFPDAGTLASPARDGAPPAPVPTPVRLVTTGPRSGSHLPGPDDLSGLVAAAQEGDSRAFERLVEATYRETYTMALRLTGNVEDARDVTQEAYLRAYRGLERFRGDAQFSTWMYRITANTASTHLGRRRRHRHDELPPSGDVVDLRHDADPALVADAGELRDRLVAALEVLPSKLRAVVVLRDVYELPHEAIAEELGISVTAAKVRLHRARHRLRGELFPELDEVGSREV